MTTQVRLSLEFEYIDALQKMYPDISIGSAIRKFLLLNIELNEYRCPRCGSYEVNQYSLKIGPMWCDACNFRVHDKLQPNPFKI